jgi:deaminated glutathione amidase
MTVRIALAQMTSGIDPAANLTAISDAAERAAAGGASMLFLPEMALLLDRDRARSSAHVTREGESPWPTALAQIARQNGLWLHAGSAPFLNDSGTQRVNRTLVFAPDGQRASVYDKVHMFDVDLPTGESWRESALYQGGDQLAWARSPAGLVGLTICYDLRFAELYAALAAGGAMLIAVPAAFTVPTGAAHWHILLRARAIENACFIIAPAQCGVHEDGRETYGHSIVIDPWGRILAAAEDEESASAPTLLFADIDSDEISKARDAIPLARSRAQRRLPFSH